MRMKVFGVSAVLAMMMLVIFPVFAATGTKTAPGSGKERLEVNVLSESAGFTDAHISSLSGSAHVVDMRGDSGSGVDGLYKIYSVDSGQKQPPAMMESTGLLGQTRLYRNLYVSNQRAERNGDSLDKSDNRYNTLWVSMTWDRAYKSGDRVTVKSPSGETVGVSRPSSGDGSKAGDTTHIFLQVIEPVSTGNVPPGAIEADDGDRITVEAGTVLVDVMVDGESPSITDITPAHDTLTSKSSVIVSFTVTDSGSGLRTDSEDGDAMGAYDDNDGIDREPLSYLSNEAAVDISLHWNVDKDGNKVDKTNEDETKRGSGDWIEETKDRSYSLRYTRRGLGTGDVYWSLSAVDRVGNRTAIDADPDKAGAQPYKFGVDRDGPDANGNIYAGVGFDNEKGDNGGEVSDNRSIMLLFVNDNRRTDIDPLNSQTVDVSDFRVRGNTVVAVTHPNLKRKVDSKGTTAKTDDVCASHTGIVKEPGKSDDAATTKVDESKCIDTRNRVYLTLRDALDGDERPEVSIVGNGVEDVDGNDNVDIDDVEAEDRIAPAVTIVIEGDVDADGRPLAKEKFIVRVSTEERLRSTPKIYMARLNLAVDSDGDMTYTVGNLIDNGTARNKGRNQWEIEFESKRTTTLAAVLYYAEDRGGNGTFSAGWDGDNGSNPDGDELDIGKLASSGLLVQYDGQFAGDGKLSVNIDPDTDDSDNDLETESRHPFLVLDFSASGSGDETRENGLTSGGKAYHTGTDSDGNDVRFDAYREVVIDSVTLNGENVKDGLGVEGDAKFFLSLSDLAVGDYTLIVQASDTAENAKEFEVPFEVLARSAYRVDLRPGWNLISLPAHPEDSLIDTVLSNTATQTLSYQDGEWVTAIWDDENETWVGTLTEIMAGYGYWVRTDRFARIEPYLPEAQPTSVLPTVPVVQGWNLLGVVDFRQRKAGDAVAKADDYFSSIEWALAYAFDTQRNRWAKLSEGDATAMVKSGKGYWVWATEAGVLVP